MRGSDDGAIDLEIFGVTREESVALVRAIKINCKIGEEDARLHAEYLVKRSFGSPPPFVWHKNDLKNLDEFWRALRTIATIDERLSPGAREYLRGCFVKHYLPDDISGLGDYEEVFGAVTWLDRLQEAWRPVSRAVEHKISEAPAEGQTNWHGVAIISACRICWLQSTGAEAPARGLNLASPFGNFVQDIFQILEPGVTAAAAFKAWTRGKVPS